MAEYFTFTLVSGKTLKSLILLSFCHAIPNSSIERGIKLTIFILGADQLDKIYSIEKKAKSNFRNLI